MTFSSEFVVERLNDGHFLEFFDCRHDNNALGLWLSGKAREYDSRNQSRVWIMRRQDDLENPVGYYSLSSLSIGGGSLLKRDRKGIPASAEHPAQLLGKFALDQGVQGTDAGALLMRSVWEKHLAVAALTGSRFLALHVRHPSLEDYYRRYGFETSSRGDGSGNGLVLMTMSTDRVQSTLDAISTL